MHIELWFEFGSTYSYPAVWRIGGLAETRGVKVAWKPFLLGPIFADQGWNDSPFNLYPAKGRYMWRDLERVCAKHGLPFQRPTQFPRNGLLAARVALAAEGEAWIGAFVRGVYRANFAEDRDIADAAVVRDCVEACGASGEAWIERAVADSNKRALRQRTELAARLGIFGAPTFRAGDELFWGNDRLEDALAWLSRASGSPAAARRRSA